MNMQMGNGAHGFRIITSDMSANDPGLSNEDVGIAINASATGVSASAFRQGVEINQGSMPGQDFGSAIAARMRHGLGITEPEIGRTSRHRDEEPGLH